MTYIIVASKKQLGSQYFTKLNLQHMCIVFLVTNFFPRSDDAHVNKQKYEDDNIHVSFFQVFSRLHAHNIRRQEKFTIKRIK